MGTGYMVFVLLLLNYLIAFDPSASPKNIRSGGEELQDHGLPTSRPNPGTGFGTARYEWKPNIVDEGLLRWTRIVSKKVLKLCGLGSLIVDPARSTHIQDCFNRVMESCGTRSKHRTNFPQCIIGLCDVQIATGISILGSGFASLNGDMSNFHWEIMVNLAWFSCVTHLSGLVALRTYFQHHSWKRRLRISLMAVLLVALLVARIPTGFMGESLVLQPAICLFDIRCAGLGSEPLQNTETFKTMLFSVALLVFGFISRSLKLSPSLSSMMQHFIRKPCKNLSQRLIGWLARISLKLHGEHSQSELHRSPIAWLWRQILVNPAFAVYLVARYQLHLFNSVLAEVSR